MEIATHHALDRPTAALSSGRPRLPAADGLRGAAALLIVVYHTSFTAGTTVGPGLIPAVIARLDVCVPVFFGLSGFLLFEPYVVRIVHDRPLAPMATFWRRRAVRIFPAYWTALAIQLAIGAIAVSGFVGLLLSVTLTHAYAGIYVLSGISQAWSVSTEIGYYLLLPLFALLCARVARSWAPAQRVMLIAAMCGSWIVISTVSRALIHGSSLPYAGNFRFTVIANADYFAVGMILACLVVGTEVSPRMATLRLALFRRPSLWYAASLVVLVLVSTQLGLPRGLEEGSTTQELARQVGYSLVALLAVAPACCSLTGGRFFGSRPLVWLGVVSYGVYLWHEVFITAPDGRESFLLRWFGWHVFDAPVVPLMALTIAGSLALGAASWYLLERPLLERFR